MLDARTHSQFWRYAAALVLSCVASCAHRLPALDSIAGAHGFGYATVTTRLGLRHRIVSAAGAQEGPVRIYMEGDGMPWIGEFVPARDPTPRTLVAFELMAAGAGPALYVGRPCYFGLAADAACEPLLWTHARFGSRVQQSMADAIRIALQREGWQDRTLVLVGFSGGGTLAALLAGEVPRVCALVTVASPLDIDEWADDRGYSRLDASDNPADRPPLPATVAQLHLRGDRDGVVAADNGVRFFAANRGAERRVVPAVGHGPEWSENWKEIDRQIVRLGRCGASRTDALRTRD